MFGLPLWAQYVSLALVALVATVLVLWGYNRREQRRKHALELARLMRDWGLSWFSEAYEDYAVGDYSGLVYKVKEVVNAVRSDQAMLSKLDTCFWRVFEHYKKDPAKLEEIKKALQTVTVVPVQAPAATSQPAAQ